jgi:guanine nucleotide-binding protein alpha-1 subunit
MSFSYEFLVQIDFMLKFANKAWIRERSSWRSVIQLNLVRSVITIFDLLQAEKDGDSISEESGDDQVHLVPRITVGQNHEVLRLRLVPLRRVETDLMRRLGIETPQRKNTASLPRSGMDSFQDVTTRYTNETVVRGWKDALDKRPNHMGTSPLNKDRDTDEATQVIAACREDMKALWADETIQALIKLHQHHLEHLSI